MFPSSQTVELGQCRLERGGAPRLPIPPLAVSTTWKVGLNYSPVDDLRLRATRSHDIRAPNLSELFQGGTGSSYTSVFDTKLQQAVQVRQVGSGNLNLKPEKSETWTGGAVYQPGWLPGFALSVDYYKIAIAQAISSIGAATLSVRRAAGNALYCQSVVFNANGTVNYEVQQPLRSTSTA